MSILTLFSYGILIVLAVITVGSLLYMLVSLLVQAAHQPKQRRPLFSDYWDEETSDEDMALLTGDDDY